MSRRHWSIPLLVLAVALGDDRPAEGGTEEQRPDPQALFGQAPETRRPVTLVNASVFSGAGESLSGDDGGGQSALTQSSYLGIQTTTTYARRNPNRMFSAGAGTAVRYFPESGQFVTVDRSARIGLETRLGARTRLSASQSVQYSPFHQFGQAVGASTAFEGESPLSNADGALAVGRSSYDLGTSVSLERNARRSSLSLGYTSRMNLYSQSVDNLITHRAGIGFRLKLGRYASLVLGTASRFGRTSGGTPRTQTQDIDLGIDYNRPLSFSRQTTLTFTTGTAMITRKGTSSDPLELGRRFRVIGNVTAARTFGRHWQARLGYDRNLQFVDAFPDPFYANGVTAQVTGQIGRRMSLRLQADYANGKAVEAEAVELDKSFRGARSQVRLNFAVSRHLQLYAEHHYTENHLSAGALRTLPPGLVPTKYGRGVRVGLAIWAPRVH